MGNNSDDSPSQRAEEELRIRTWKGTSLSMPLKLQNQSHLAVIYTLKASYLAEFLRVILSVIAGIVKRMDKKAEIENIGA